MYLFWLLTIPLAALITIAIIIGAKRKQQGKSVLPVAFLSVLIVLIPFIVVAIINVVTTDHSPPVNPLIPEPTKTTTLKYPSDMVVTDQQIMDTASATLIGILQKASGNQITLKEITVRNRNITATLNTIGPFKEGPPKDLGYSLVQYIAISPFTVNGEEKGIIYSTGYNITVVFNYPQSNSTVKYLGTATLDNPGIEIMRSDFDKYMRWIEP